MPRHIADIISKRDIGCDVGYKIRHEREAPDRSFEGAPQTFDILGGEVAARTAQCCDNRRLFGVELRVEISALEVLGRLAARSDVWLYPVFHAYLLNVYGVQKVIRPMVAIDL